MNLIELQRKRKRQDIIITPLPIVERMISMMSASDGETVLDPCYGPTGVFYNNFPTNVKKYWCEIERGIDFFEDKHRYHWVVGNPPYSQLDKWLKKTYTMCDAFIYIIGVMNFTPKRLQDTLNEGYSLVEMVLVDVKEWPGCSLILHFNKTTKRSTTFVDLMRKKIKYNQEEQEKILEIMRERELELVSIN